LAFLAFACAVCEFLPGADGSGPQFSKPGPGGHAAEETARAENGRWGPGKNVCRFFLHLRPHGGKITANPNTVIHLK